MNKRLVLVIIIVAILCILLGVGITVMGTRLSRGLANLYSSVVSRLPHRQGSKPDLIVIDSQSDANSLRAATSDVLRQHGALPAAPPINENKVAGGPMRPSESNDANTATATTSEEKELREGSNPSASNKEYNRNTNPVLPSGKTNPLAKPTPEEEERAVLKKMWDEGDENLRRLMREEGYIPDEELEKIKNGNKSEQEPNDQAKDNESKSDTGNKSSKEHNESTQNRTTSESVNPGALGEMAFRIAKEYNNANNKNNTNNASNASNSTNTTTSPDLPKTSKPGEGAENTYLVNPVLQVVAVDRRNRGTLGSTSGQLGGANELTTIFDLRNHLAANGFIGRFNVNITVNDYRGGYVPPMFNIKLVSLSGSGNAINYRVDRLMWSRTVTGTATASFAIPAIDTNQVGILVSASSVDPRCNVSYSVQLSK